MTKPLSPAANAVLDAACTLADLLNREVSQAEMIAAALRALAEYVVLPKYQYAEWELAHQIHSEITAIAAELEAEQ